VCLRTESTVASGLCSEAALSRRLEDKLTELGGEDKKGGEVQDVVGER
jgi:hypothetical protein